EIFVANAFNVTAYARTASGNVAPLRTLTTASNPEALALDTTRDLLWVSSYDASSGTGHLYAFHRNFANGADTPLQLALNVAGARLAVNPVHDQIFLSDFSSPAALEVYNRSTIPGGPDGDFTNGPDYAVGPRTTTGGDIFNFSGMAYDSTSDQLLGVAQGSQAVLAHSRTAVIA